ncbi:helix-hairpin-helix domain-containing protein [Eubacterium multiforme]|uniref:Competence protein ComEA n=1 Tax=Eubacterium multiforme TaxID=83339 RepID=A0ABT9UPV1_9FIRM|nr:helix-hairpin-helix domain-containing protein [Eubacterium multiforme]MDQ0148677.1 competence protein ComEA [Eubacterium multiforme]
MDVKKKSIGLILIGLIIGGIVFGLYLFKGRESLNKNNNETIFVEESGDVSDINASKSNDKNGENINLKDSNEESIKLKDNKIVVDIKGEVKNEGVYYLEDGSIIEDLIKEAGGLTKKAALDYVNRAEKLKNNMCVIIPNKDNIKKLEKESKETSAPLNSSLKDSNSSKEEKININTADESELNKINGIGPSKAKAIITYREESGGFKSIEDIKNVSGIGEGTFLKIKDSICV